MFFLPIILFLLLFYRFRLDIDLFILSVIFKDSHKFTLVYLPIYKVRAAFSNIFISMILLVLYTDFHFQLTSP